MLLYIPLSHFNVIGFRKFKNKYANKYIMPLNMKNILSSYINNWCIAWHICTHILAVFHVYLGKGGKRLFIYFYFSFAVYLFHRRWYILWFIFWVLKAKLRSVADNAVTVPCDFTNSFSSWEQLTWGSIWLEQHFKKSTWILIEIPYISRWIYDSILIFCFLFERKSSGEPCC